MEKKFSATRWKEIDNTDNPENYFGYLDKVNSLETIKQMKATTFELLNIQEGDNIVDIGCGTGEDASKMAEIVGQQGSVIGIDASKKMIEEAQRRAHGIHSPVKFCVSDIQQLDFPDNTFNASRADRIFVHLDNPNIALSEMIRVTKKNGKIIVSDADWGTLAIDSNDNRLTRKIVNFFCDSSGTRCVGRQLWRLFHDAGLENVKAVSQTLIINHYEIANKVFKLEETAFFAQKHGIVTSNEVNEWINHFKMIEDSGRFFASLTYFFVLGLKNH